MSFILDALKKSDSERQRQSGPVLFEIRTAPRRGGLPVWAIVLGVLLLVNLVALVWFVTRAPARDAAAAGVPVATGGTAMTSAATPATTGLAPTAATAVTAATTTVATTPATASAAMPSATPTAMPAVTPPGTAAVLPPRPADATATSVAAATGAAADPDYTGNPADYEEALPADRPPPAHASRDTAERNMVPTIAQLPAAIGNQLPPLRLDLHVYATRAADRFVMINMQRLREGDATQDGVRVEEITPSGAILSFRGTRFQLERE